MYKVLEILREELKTAMILSGMHHKFNIIYSPGFGSSTCNYASHLKKGQTLFFVELKSTMSFLNLALLSINHSYRFLKCDVTNTCSCIFEIMAFVEIFILI